MMQLLKDKTYDMSKNNEILNKNKIDLMTPALYATIFLATFVITYYYTFLQMGDYTLHMSFIKEFKPLLAGKLIQYPVWHLVASVIYHLFHLSVNYSAAFSSSIFALLTAIVIHKACRYFLKDKVSIYLTDFIVLMLSFVGPLYLSWINVNYYNGTCSPNLWHNPTNNAVKPFAIAITFLFIYVYQMDSSRTIKFLKFGFNRQNLCLAGLSMALLFSAVVKPSFIQIFLPAAGIFLLTEFIASHGKKIKLFFKGCLMLVPCILAFILLYFCIYKSANSEGIILSPFNVWGYFVSNIPAAIIALFAFPLVVIVLFRKKLFKDKYLFISILMVVFGMLEFILFMEDGNRMYQGNFGWGYILSSSILWVITVIRFFEYYAENKTSFKLWKRIGIYCGSALLALHFLFGMWFYWSTLINLGFLHQ